jgi:uncharacterized membrane protein YgcG
MADGGQLTQSEKEELSASLAKNIESVDKEITAAGGDAGKVAKLQSKRSAIATRKAAIDGAPAVQRRLRHGEEIQKLRLKLFPLLALEDRGRSMSLTLADLKTLEEKSEIEEKITQLENASRGWFEDETDFRKLCELEEKEAKAKWAARKPAQKKTGATGSTAKGATGASKSGGGAWSTAGSKSSSGFGGGYKAGGGGSGAKKSTGGFAAAFGGDSDSD